MQTSMTYDEAIRRIRAQEEINAGLRKERRERALVAGIRLRDAVVGRLYRITALYSGDTGVYEYAGYQGTHDYVYHGSANEAFNGVCIGATGFFRNPVYGSTHLYGGGSLEPGGRGAQWFMEALPEEEVCSGDMTTV